MSASVFIMRIKYLLIILLVISSKILPQANWHWIAPYPQANVIRAMDSFGQYIFFKGDNRTFMSSSDGANTFYINSPFTLLIGQQYYYLANDDIAFSDSLNGFVNDVYAGELRTTNGGKTWTQTGASDLGIIKFISPSLGWKFTDFNYYKTTDGGNSWNIFYSFPYPQNQLANGFVLDSNKFWTLTQNGFNTTGAIYYSNDGGKTIQQQYPIGIGYKPGYDSFNAVHVNKSGLGIIVGTVNYPDSVGNKGFILRTTNFGANWWYAEYPDVDFQSVVSINDSIWVLTGNHIYSYDAPVVYRSSDFGNSWTEISSPIGNINNNNFNHIYSTVFNSFYNVIVSSTQKGLFKSADFGVTFTPISKFLNLNIGDFSLDENSTSINQTVVAAGDSNSLLLSRDGGWTWVKKIFPFPNYNMNSYNLTKKVLIRDNKIFLLDYYSGIFFSTDFGDSWTSIASDYNFNNNSLSMSVLDSNNFAYSVSSGSTNLYSTTDGGFNWLKSYLPQSAFINDVQILSQNNIWACGSLNNSNSGIGFIYHTTDGGLDWRIIDMPIPISVMKMLNTNRGIAFGSSQIFYTIDGGKSWQQSFISQNYSSNPAFAFSDSLHGILNSNGYFYETVDGGMTWSSSSIITPLSGQLTKIAYNKAGNMIILGPNGAFLISYAKTNYGSTTFDIKKDSKNIEFKLNQNYPNPFNPTTIITYYVQKSSFVTIKVYDIIGRKVATLVNSIKAPGTYIVNFDAGKLASGVYFCNMQSGNFIDTKKLILIK